MALPLPVRGFDGVVLLLHAPRLIPEIRTLDTSKYQLVPSVSKREIPLDAVSTENEDSRRPSALPRKALNGTVKAARRGYISLASSPRTSSLSRERTEGCRNSNVRVPSKAYRFAHSGSVLDKRAYARRRGMTWSISAYARCRRE